MDSRSNSTDNARNNPTPSTTGDQLRLDLQAAYRHLLDIESAMGERYSRQLGDILENIEDSAHTRDKGTVRVWRESLLDKLETRANPFFNYYCVTNHNSLMAEMRVLKYGVGQAGNLVRRVLHRDRLTREIDPKYTIEAMLKRMALISPVRYRHDELKKQIDKIKVSMTPHPEISDFDRAWVSPLWERLLSDEENLDDPERYYKIAVIINNVREQTAVYRRNHLEPMSYGDFNELYNVSRVFDEMELIESPLKARPVVLPPLPKPRSTPQRFAKLYRRNPGPGSLRSIGIRQLRLHRFKDHGEARGGGRLFEPGPAF